MPNTRFAPGDTIGNYRLVRSLGEGAGAWVWLAEIPGMEGFNQPVALKILKDDIHDAMHYEGMINEGRLGQHLNHPHVAKVYRYEEIDDLHLLVMEYVPGWTVEHILTCLHLHSMQMPASVALELTLRVVEGLEYVHGLDVVHRDLKPANLMVTPEGHVKVCDMGMARSDLNAFKTAVGDRTVKGTPAYMSPEQVHADHVDHRSDQFAVGVILYELLTLKRAFVAKDLRDLMVKVAQVDTMFVECLTERVEDQGALDVVRRCLRNDPDERYPETGELKRVLMRLLSNIGGPTLPMWLAEMKPRMDRAESMLDASVADLPRLPRQHSPEAHTVSQVVASPVEPSAPEMPSLLVEPLSLGTEPVEEVTRPQRTPGQVAESRRRLLRDMAVAAVFLVLIIVGWMWIDGPDKAPTVPPPSEPEVDLAADLVPEPSLADAFEGLETQKSKPRPVARRKAPPSDSLDDTVRASEPEGADLSVLEPSPSSEPKDEQDLFARLDASRRASKGLPPENAGTLSVNSVPHGNVYIDQVHHGSTPLLNKELSAGEYAVQVRVTIDRYDRIQARTVTVKEGELTKVIFNFEE